MTDVGSYAPVTLPKYTRPEYERKFVVRSSAWKHQVQPYHKQFEDLYLAAGRMRLRAMTDSDTRSQTFKLCKKFASNSPYWQPIVNIYLSEAEYRQFSCLEGHRLSKTRYYHEYRGRTFSIDVFHGCLDPLVMCEVEADTLSELMDIQFPTYAVIEVTEDPFFTGGSLCRTTDSELTRKLDLMQIP